MTLSCSTLAMDQPTLKMGHEASKHRVVLVASTLPRRPTSKKAVMPLPDTKTVAIASIPTSSPEQRKEDTMLEAMLRELNNDDLAIAARANYEYRHKLLATNAKTAALDFEPETNVFQIQQQQHDAAKHLARRFWRSKLDYTKATEKLKANIEFRRRMELDRLCSAFDNFSNHNDDGITKNTNDFSACFKQRLQSKHLYVQGYDKEGRSTFIFIPRNLQGHDVEWTMKEHMYTLERAIACSKAPDKTVNAVVDFEGFSMSKHAPPMHIGKEFMLTLRHHYAGSVNQIFLVDAPSTFLCLWSVLKPFLGSKTRNKIHFVNSGKHSRSKKNSQTVHFLDQWYDRDQTPSWMMPQGTKNRPLDMDEYLHETPFNMAFDELPRM